jgi:hypothetical protein
MNQLQKNYQQQRIAHLAAWGKHFRDQLIRTEDMFALVHFIDESIATGQTNAEFKMAFQKTLKDAKQSRADQLGVSMRTVDNWLARWGLQILRDDIGDDFLFERLGMLQRKGKQTRHWMNAIRAQRMAKLRL